jgi:hypothetical protein
VPYLEVFVYLQILDLITTLLGFRLGGYELSPGVRALMQIGPTAGVVLAKVGAFLLAGVCVWFRKDRVIRWANYFFAVIVLWNLGQIMKVLL